MLFDIRTIVGTLLGVYGVILIVTGLAADYDHNRSGGWNVNLWAGVGMAVVALAFLTWVRLRPVKALTHETPEGGE
ncbi:hypothetical protein [Nocardia pseudobrasiliensis]|uniref:Uncharacterized protein n=1 Tax=Nocardia pseudobrasiliensis TaxID=45979 RepID=A0A370IDX2_9NOCA|nr:hypothetical protein [Nocardia pseudobrasiliensis]RDI68918.1 hypothetical protein DFR76_101454 [Nocardia pseudobrasiliensis]